MLVKFTDDTTWGEAANISEDKNTNGSREVIDTAGKQYGQV